MKGAIVLTDPPPLPSDDPCPRCGAGRELRKQSQVYGPVHDVCGVCRHSFKELTVPELQDEASM